MTEDQIKIVLTALGQGWAYRGPTKTSDVFISTVMKTEVTLWLDHDSAGMSATGEQSFGFLMRRDPDVKSLAAEVRGIIQLAVKRAEANLRIADLVKRIAGC